MSAHPASTRSRDGLRLAYAVAEPGSEHGSGSEQRQPTLIFVHGWCGDRSVWRHQLAYFAHRYRVVALDLAGHGESEGGRALWTMSAFGDDVACVAEAVTGTVTGENVPLVLIGHSMAGEVIVEAARALADSGHVVGLIGIDCLWDPDRDITAELIETTLEPFRADYAAAAGAYVRDLFLPEADPALVESLVRSMVAVPASVGLGALEQILLHRPVLRESLRQLEAPISVINSMDWRPMNLDAARRYGIEVRELPGVGHFSMLEEPGAVNGLIDRILERKFLVSDESGHYV